MPPPGSRGSCTASQTTLQLLAVLLLVLAVPITAPDAAQLAPPVASGGRRLQAAPRLPLNRIRLPPRFSIDLYVDASFPARFMELGQADANATVVYVSSTQDKVGQAGQEVVCCLCAVKRQQSPFARHICMCHLQTAEIVAAPCLAMLDPCALPLQVTALVSRGGAPAQACTLLSGLDNPNGIAYDRSTKSLYVAEVGQLGRGGP